MTIEGDSCFLIEMDRKLSMGKKDEKTVSNWNLLKMMEALGTLIATNQAWNFGHIRREDDKFYDLIENVGIRRGHNIIERKLQAFKGKYWVDQFHHLDSIDHVATRRVGRGENMTPNTSYVNIRMGYIYHTCHNKDIGRKRKGLSTLAYGMEG